MKSTPSRNGAIGRDTSGRFTRGKSDGPGYPHARRTAELRSFLLDAVSDADLRDIITTMVKAVQG